MAGIEAELHETAVLEAGYHDFGDDLYREGLQRLLEAIDASGYTTEERWRIRKRFVVTVLRSRLYSQRGWQERPECLRMKLRPPLIILGMPRTGTTALHNMIAVDRGFQGLNGWLVFYPMPRPPRYLWSSIREYRLRVEVCKAALHPDNKLKAIHLRTADDVDEALELEAQAFVSNMFPGVCHLPDYDTWLHAQRQVAVYSRLADNLRLIGSNEPEKPWLLKNPDHLLAIDDLLEVFPDARIVWTHRHPAPAMASVSSLLSGVRRGILGAQVGIDDIPQREVEVWSKGVSKAMALRDRHPACFHDVDYNEFVIDPIGVIRRIYDRFDISLDPTTERAMRAWLAANPQRKYGVHSYGSLPSVSDAQIEQQFAAYIERFRLTKEPAV